MPAFSIMTPVYNGEAYILRCYEMLRLQTVQDWEWVVVDDGSTDRTAELVRGLADERVRLISYTPNKGRGYGRSVAIEASRGEWVVVWDADDMYFPDRLERLAQSQRTGYDFACSYCVMVDNDLAFKNVRGFPHFGDYRIFVHLTLAARRDLMLAVGYAPWFHTAEDVTMVYTLAASYRGEYIDDALTICQEDREVHLEKALVSNHSMWTQLQAMQNRGALRMEPRAYRRFGRRMRLKLQLLAWMRWRPSLYLKTVGRRTVGTLPAEWELSAERKAFLASLRQRWGRQAAVETAASAVSGSAAT